MSAFTVLIVACGDGTAPINSVPEIERLSPSTIEQWSHGVSIAVLGSEFTPESGVRVNTNDRATRFVSSGELQATLMESDFTRAGVLDVVVFNPGPGGGTSNVAKLVVTEGPNPIPTISAVSPGFLLVDTASSELTITGTGFLTNSVVAVAPGFEERNVSYLSSELLRTTLSAEDLSANRTLHLRIINPAPGGGPSDWWDFEVRSPQPEITSLGAVQTTAGQSSFTLAVHGTGFTDSSVVLVNGLERTTDLTAPGTLEASLIGTDLAAAAELAIAVANPSPGGGTSTSHAFTVVVGEPEITLLPSQGATMGGPGFTLYIHGRYFVDGSTVYWEGTRRATQYFGSTRIAATITAEDVATAGTRAITVVNPTPGGGISAPAFMTVRNTGDVTAVSTVIDLQCADIAYDSTRGLLYLSVTAVAPTNANSIVAIDPTTGAITDSTFVGSSPAKLSISDDDRLLYVALNGANAVRRIDLDSFSPGIQWSVGAGQIAGDMVVIPGFPNSVAVSRQTPGISPPLQGVTVYDDGVARTVDAPGHTGANRLEALESSEVLYGYNNSHTGFEFFRIGIDVDGARHLSSTGGLISGFNTNIVGSSGRIYGTDGSIVDADRSVRIGAFPTGSVVLAVDAGLGRAFLQSGPEISVYDLNNFQLLGTVSVPRPATGSPTLVRWGVDGLSYIDSTRVFIVRSPIFGH